MTIPYGIAERKDNTYTLRYQLRLPYSIEKVWDAIASPSGLVGWLATADVFEPKLNGAITLRWLNADNQGESTIASGRITAWQPKQLVEYTISVHGRIRFTLSQDGTGTILDFINDLAVPAGEHVSYLAGWHDHFEFLQESLAGRPMQWSSWSPERWSELYAEYERRFEVSPE